MSGSAQRALRSRCHAGAAGASFWTLLALTLTAAAWARPRGHHAVARQIFDVAKHGDSSAEVEAPGLIPGTDLRPADVLTGACGHGLMALDIGIANPDAEPAGEDCTATMYAEKIERYSAYAAILDAQNVANQPLVRTADGRSHTRTTAAHLRPDLLGREAARTRSGGTSACGPQWGSRSGGAPPGRSWPTGRLARMRSNSLPVPPVF